MLRPMIRQYYVYIMTNESGTLYTGVTNNLTRRVGEHKLNPTGFAKKYRTSRLVHFEQTSDIRSAIEREKQIKGWLRAKKIALVKSTNPNWRDLAKDDFDPNGLSPQAR